MRSEIGTILDGAPENEPAAVVLWRPPANEHRLAQSLGLVGVDRDEYRRRLEVAKTEAEARGCRVKITRARCHRVVHTLARLGLANEPDARAAAFVFLWSERREES